MRNKMRKVLLISAIAIVTVVLLWLFVITPFLAPRIRTPFIYHNTESYISGEYKNYSGGQIAYELFPNPQEIGTYEELEFIYANNFWKSSPFSRWGNSFLLNIHYSESEYEKSTALFSSNYALKSYDEKDVYVSRDGFVFSKKLSSDQDETIHNFYIIFYDETKMISFVFIENDTLKSRRAFVDLNVFVEGSISGKFDTADEEIAYEEYMKNKYYY